jgi:choline dehydrogenase-like flavoprotein
VIVTGLENVVLRDSGNCVIIGSGFAGMILARRLRELGQRVVVIESGALQEPGRWVLSASPFAKADYRMGQDYIDLHVQRMFGGGAIVWGGWCAALRSVNFVQGRFPGYTGWPISYGEVAAYYASAGQVLGLKKAADIGIEEIALPGNSEVAVKPYDLSPPIRINNDWLEATQEDPGLILVTETTVERLDEMPDGVRLHLRSRGGKISTIVAPRVVLAAGSVIGAALLGKSAETLNIAVESRPHIGRNLLEHPYIYSAGSLIIRPNLAPLIRKHSWWFANFLSLVPPTPLLQQMGVPDFHVLLSRLDPSAQTPQQRAALAAMQAISGEVGDLYSAIIGFEMLPNKETHVTPHAKISPLPFEGNSQVDLKFDAVTQETATKALAWLRVKVASTFIDPPMPTEIVAVGHLMGTTRMAASPALGVVDRDLKVFGTRRTYVCGSSVFPTCGFVNPTLTIGALALRLAHHLWSQP